jgi:hypothetical protein
MRRWREASAAVSEEERYGVTIVAGECQVQLVVAVEVAQNRLGWPVWHFDRTAVCRTKSPIAVAKQHGDAAAAHYDEVGLAVLIQLANDNISRCFLNYYGRIWRRR